MPENVNVSLTWTLNETVVSIVTVPPVPVTIGETAIQILVPYNISYVVNISTTICRQTSTHLIPLHYSKEADNY